MLIYLILTTTLLINISIQRKLRLRELGLLAQHHTAELRFEPQGHRGRFFKQGASCWMLKEQPVGKRLERRGRQSVSPGGGRRPLMMCDSPARWCGHGVFPTRGRDAISASLSQGNPDTRDFLTSTPSRVRRGFRCCLLSPGSLAEVLTN